MTSSSLSIFGAGRWGTALAMLAAHHQEVTMWGHLPEHIAACQTHRENQASLPGIPLPRNIILTSNLADAALSQTWLLVTPTHAIKHLLEQLKPHIQPNTQIAWACKGLSEDGSLLSHWFKKILFTEKLAMISGPNFAREVALGLPAATIIASHCERFSFELSTQLSTDRFRAYQSTDLDGVSLASAMKNVLAIGVGLCDGLQLGANARAALMTRGLHEMTRLGLALGGKKETFLGLAGMGDLVLTCCEDQSRNRQYGLALADPSAAPQSALVEGKRTAPLLLQLANQAGISLPICEQVNQLINQEITPTQAIQNLFNRPLKSENLF